ncbi:ABC transporter ATP-binding protein [Candidatus Woesearchaeota archaeon]|nr:ABC transporter ATP-binding protein [Candidatus Woesearchaeota archaeon]
MAEDGKRQRLQIDFRYNLKVFYGLLERYWPLFGTLLCVIFVIEATNVVDKFLFKEIIDRGAEFTEGTLLRAEFTQSLLLIAAVFVAQFLVRMAFRWLFIHLINRLDGSLIRDLKERFFSHLIHLSYDFHTTHRTGSLISRLVRGGSAIERVMDVIAFNFVPLVFQLVVVAGSMLLFDAASAAITVAVVLVFIGYSFIINSVQQASNIAANDTEDAEKASVSDIFTNIESVKYFGKERAIRGHYKKKIEASRAAWILNWDYFRWLDAGQTAIIGTGTFLLLLFPMLRFLDGGITLGTLVFIYTTFANLYGPLFGFVYGIRNFYRGMADFESLFQYGRIEPSVKDRPGAPAMTVSDGRIEFRDITFRYRKRKIFDRFSLTIEPREHVAIVGPSGSGKSTLIKLLYRLYDVEKGAILVDGTDIRSVGQHSLRSQLSVVPQECVLFDDTVYDNIRFSDPKAPRKEVLRAIRFAQLDRIIARFPLKERTVVGERGVRLSGGEKQRVSIARALLADRKVLVLDEATSSLDSETESEIQADLRRLMKGKTAIMIAHRLSTIMQADRIVVLDGGRIAQQGTHDSLIRRRGLYRRLWDLQRGGYLR